MSAHRIDGDLAHKWASIGDSAGGAQTYVPVARCYDGGGIVQYLARLQPDGVTVRVTKASYDPAGELVREPFELQRRYAIDDDDELEEPVYEPVTMTLSRFLRQQAKPIVVLVPWDWEPGEVG